MKKFFLLIIITCTLLNLHCFAQEYGWVNISANLPTEADLSDVFFIDDFTGWITSSSHAEIYHTTDGGETFEVQTTQLACNAIHMLNENEGYTGGESGFVYRTTDGGDNWGFYGTMVATLADIHFPPTGDIGYCCGINGNLWSIDSSDVTEMTSGIPDNLYSISFPISSEEGWVCGGSIIRHFINNEWTAADQDYPSGGYNAIFMVDSLNGWVVGDAGIIAHTTDGQNWFEQANPDPQLNTFYNTYFINTSVGWAVGIGGIILHTTDGGINWTIEDAVLTTEDLKGVHFTSSTNGYIVGNGKTLLKYCLITSVENEEVLPTKFTLSQNYPNPFNPSTRIKYSIPVSSVIASVAKQSQEITSVTTFSRNDNVNVSLKVYDVLGREVATLVNEQQQPGSYEVSFHATDLGSGVYFYNLSCGAFLETKKMLLLK